MNVLNRLRTVIKPVNNVIVRNLRTDFKIQWKRPQVLGCTTKERSGDLQPLPKFDPNTYLFDFEKSKEFQEADDRLKKLFTIGNNRRKEMFTIYRHEMVKKVQRHPQDFYSMESKIAYMTAKIRSLQEVYPTHRMNKRMKVFLKELIEKRRRFLRLIRKHDYKRYEFLLEKLDIVYKPWPEHIYRIERKASLKKLTNEYCEQIKRERLDEYRKELESKQLDFLEKKLKNLTLIRNEQLACKVKVTVTEDDIKQAKMQYESHLEKKRKQQENDEKQRAEM